MTMTKFSALFLALSALRLQTAFAQTLDLSDTTFTDGSSANPDIESITETSVTPSSFTTITVTPTDGGVNEPTFPATLTTCFVVSTAATATETESLDPSASLPVGAMCYEFIREGGGLNEIPLLQVGSDGLTTPYLWSTASFPGDTAPTDLGTSSSSSTITSSSSSSKKTGKIVGAVLGSIFGCILIGGILLYLRRHQRKSSNNRRFSRAANWMRNRPGGWVADEKAPQNFEMQSQQSPSPPRPTHF
ncbi:hypothetical protein SCHPADRAFT_911620 [Schizopora paradoxa]|uniref:Mid2 domain-containing protein n=1 Tax=Schizopora paradoxa TaxID=27342 RepID=A0A0H2QZS5_9AGAM|nr:hypothetical protein SCHPADRAFT_911620 [Schizopora paradoxa]